MRKPDYLVSCCLRRLGGLARCVLMTGLVGAVLAGCAGQEHYDRGRQLLAAGKYDEAVRSFDEALSQSPGNGRFHDGLLEAKSLAADEHVKQAAQLVEGKRLSDARKELDIALKLMPAHPEGVPLAAKIAPQIAECDKTIARAREALARQDWAEGARLITEAYKIDPSHPQVEELRREAADTVAGRQLTAARKALDSRNWDAALAACEQARKVEPANPEIAAIERQVKDRREAMRFYETARPLIAKEDLGTAIGPLQQAAALWPENQDIRSELDRAKNHVVDQLSTRARTETQGGRYQAAVESLDEAMAFDPARDSLRQQRRQVLDGWGARLMEEYQRHKAKGNWELAWTTAVEALALSPTDPERIRQACLSAEEGVRRSIAYNLNVLLAQTDEARLNDVLAICNVLLEEIGKNRPDHVRLTEQSVLSKLLAEFSVSYADIGNRDKLQAVGRRLKGANAFLFVGMRITNTSSLQDSAQDPATGGPAGPEQLDLRMTLVDVATGRQLWSVAELLPLADGSAPARPVSPESPVAIVSGAEPITTATIAALRPAIRSRVIEMFWDHAGSYRQTASAPSGDQVVENNVRFLFDMPGMPDAATLDAVLTALFGPRMSGDLLVAAKRAASERLALAKGSAWQSQGSSDAGVGPVLLPSPSSKPAETTSPPPVPEPSVSAKPQSRPAIAPPTKAATRAPADTDSEPPAAAPAVPVPSVPVSRPADEPVKVFQGVISRDDNRYAKELPTVDGIIVKVLDTDEDPLDADLEIRVGNAKKKYDDKPVGSRIGGYGQSGRAYVIVILRIEDKTETVHFAVETVPD